MRCRPEAPVQRSAFWFLWPMSTINLMPGDMAVTLFWFNPLSPDPHRSARHHLYAGRQIDAGRWRPMPATAPRCWSRRTTALCESVQRGLASRGYRQGRFVADAERSAISEHAVHHFHSLVAEALGFWI